MPWFQEVHEDRGFPAPPAPAIRLIYFVEDSRYPMLLSHSAQRAGQSWTG